MQFLKITISFLFPQSNNVFSVRSWTNSYNFKKCTDIIVIQLKGSIMLLISCFELILNWLRILTIQNLLAVLRAVAPQVPEQDQWNHPSQVIFWRKLFYKIFTKNFNFLLSTSFCCGFSWRQLVKTENPQNSWIFNNAGSHDIWNQKIPKLAKMLPTVFIASFIMLYFIK